MDNQNEALRKAAKKWTDKEFPKDIFEERGRGQAEEGFLAGHVHAVKEYGIIQDADLLDSTVKKDDEKQAPKVKKFYREKARFQIRAEMLAEVLGKLRNKIRESYLQHHAKISDGPYREDLINYELADWLEEEFKEIE